MTVPVRINLYSTEPFSDLSRYDHVGRVSLALPTGHLRVHECTGGEVLAWYVEPSTYRALALFAGLQTLSSDGLEGQDRYEVALWPGRRTYEGLRTKVPPFLPIVLQIGIG